LLLVFLPPTLLLSDEGLVFLPFPHLFFSIASELFEQAIKAAFCLLLARETTLGKFHYKVSRIGVLPDYAGEFSDDDFLHFLRVHKFTPGRFA
jgi:hypothetical protein